MNLENSFYIIGIIFMSFMLVILLSLIVGVFLIKKKIDHIHSSIQDKISGLTHTFQASKHSARSLKGIFDKVKNAD